MTRTEKTLYAAGFLLLGSSVCMHFIAGNAADKNSTFAVAHLLLSGKKLYVDIVDMNMPLNFWIYALPVYVSSHFSLVKDFQALVLLGLTVIGFVIFLSTRVLMRHPEFAEDKKKQALHILLLCLVFVFYTSPAYFLDREHVFLVLAFPYILRWMPSLARARLPVWLRIITGCMAGIGFCMKPHTLIVFAGLQLIYYMREHSLRILISLENFLIYAVGVSYLVSVWLLTPEYFSLILPMALATYSAYNNRIGGVVFALIALLTFAVTFADFRLRYTSPYRKDILYFVEVCACFLAYALTNNGWSYTYYPLTGMILFTTGWVWWEYLYLKTHHEIQGLPSKQFLFGAYACAISLIANIMLILGSYAAVLTYDCGNNQGCRAPQEIAEALNDPAGVRSFGGIAFQPPVLLDLIRTSPAQWKTRFIALWMLPKFFVSGPDFTRKHQWILDYVGNAFAEDLDRGKPEVMFVGADSAFYDTRKRHISFLAFLSTYPNFRKAWQHYHYVYAIDHCHASGKPEVMHKTACRYDVYERIY